MLGDNGSLLGSHTHIQNDDHMIHSDPKVASCFCEDSGSIDYIDVDTDGHTLNQKVYIFIHIQVINLH